MDFIQKWISKKTNEEGDIVNWSLIRLTIKDMINKQINESEFFEGDRVDYFLLPEKTRFKDLERFCKNIGGKVAVTNQSSFLQISALFNSSGFIASRFWSGYTDEEEENVYVSLDGEELKESSWAAGEPNGKYIENCLITASYTSSILLKDTSCLEENYGVCEIKVPTPIKLRGDLHNLPIDRQYYWNERLVNNKFTLFGNHRTEILYDGTFWQIKDVESGQIYLEYASNVYPFGDHNWFDIRSNSSLVLGLTICNSQGTLSDH